MNRRLRVMIFLPWIISLFLSCSLTDITGVVQKSSQFNRPKWDLEIDIPILKRIEAMASYFTVSNIAAININGVPWPATQANYDLTGVPGLSSTSMSIDFNGDGNNDFQISELISNDGKGFIQFKITSDGDAITDTDFSNITCQIDNQNYSFDIYERESSQSITFRTTNFLNTSGASHDFSAVNADQFDIQAFTLDIVNRSGNLSFELSTSLGDDYNIKGNILNRVKLFSITNQQVSLGSSQIKIKKIGILLDYKNQLPFILDINAYFESGSKTYPVKDGDSNTIEIAQGSKTLDLSIDAAIFSQSSSTLSFDLYLPQKNDIIITNQLCTEIDLSIYGKGVIDTNF